MNLLSQAQVERIRQQYPLGTEVELIAMPEDPHPVPPGTRGKVVMVDDAGQLVMKWSNGSSLSLIPGVDQFCKIPQQEIKQENLHIIGDYVNFTSPQSENEMDEMNMEMR